jgi:hypothetical protein
MTTESARLPPDPTGEGTWLTRLPETDPRAPTPVSDPLRQARAVALSIP